MIELSTADVRGKRGDFRRGLVGYAQDEVDSYLEALAKRLEAMTLEHAKASERAAALSQQVKGLNNQSNAVGEALISGQRLKTQIVSQAESEAEKLLARVESEAEALLSAAAADANRDLQAARQEAERSRKESVGTLEDERRLLAAKVGRLREQLGDLARCETIVIGALEARRANFLYSVRSLVERELCEVARQEALTTDLALQAHATGNKLPAEGDASHDTLEEPPSPQVDHGGTLIPGVDRATEQGNEDDVSRLAKNIDGGLEEVVIVPLDYLTGLDYPDDPKRSPPVDRLLPRGEQARGAFEPGQGS